MSYILQLVHIRRYLFLNDEDVRMGFVNLHRADETKIEKWKEENSLRLSSEWRMVKSGIMGRWLDDSHSSVRTQQGLPP